MDRLTLNIHGVEIKPALLRSATSNYGQ